MGGKKLSMIIGGTGSNRGGNHLFRRWRLRSTWGIPSSAKPLLGWCLGRCICLTHQPSCAPLFGKLQEILLIIIMILWNMLRWPSSQNCKIIIIYVTNIFSFLLLILKVFSRNLTFLLYCWKSPFLLKHFSKISIIQAFLQILPEEFSWHKKILKIINFLRTPFLIFSIQLHRFFVTKFINHWTTKFINALHL